MNFDQREPLTAATQPGRQPDEVNPDQGDTVNPQSPTEFPPGREDIDEPQPEQPDITPLPPETPPPPD
ncbi:hypothetical protein [Allopontixanthobacter sp.]|uniref:hypothetical protein n=1 Tax=Allopontixanthobacter sp. TaxID=2906452 RepID=UPI002ABA1145|nr:hypothetical protein [Allopontixanthobacter sp.]MDZ4306480.1 hypothetical protein [Allopontixanthobacter sp.]